MAVLSILLTVILVTISILIVLIVLLQRPKQEGLGAAFGGSTLDGALGAQTTDVLQKGTTIFAVIFFVCSIGLAMIKTRQFDDAADKGVLDGLDQPKPEVPETGNPLSTDPGFNPGTLTPTTPLGLDDGQGDAKSDTKANDKGAEKAGSPEKGKGEAKGNGPAPGAKSVEDAKASDQPEKGGADGKKGDGDSGKSDKSGE